MQKRNLLHYPFIAKEVIMNFRKFYAMGNGIFHWKWHWNNLMFKLYKLTTKKKSKEQEVQVSDTTKAE